MLDLLLWLFGPVRGIDQPMLNERTVSGRLQLERAGVNWHLSIDPAHRAERTLSIGGTAWSITGFEDLHTTVYRETLAGHGHGIEDARPAVELAARFGAKARRLTESAAAARRRCTAWRSSRAPRR